MRSHAGNAAENFSFSDDEDEDDQPPGYTSLMASPLSRMHVSNYPELEEKQTDLRSETLSGLDDQFNHSEYDLEDHVCPPEAEKGRENNRQDHNIFAKKWFLYTNFGGLSY